MLNRKLAKAVSGLFAAHHQLLKALKALIKIML